MHLINLLKKYNTYFIYSLLIKFQIKFFKKRILKNIFTTKFKSNALVYFKSDIFFSNLIAKMSTHTNNIEIKAICETLKDMNYNVYLVDRDARIEEIDSLKEEDFEIFISNASGNSAKFHDYIIKNFSIKKKFFYASGPEPHFSNELVLERHTNFDKKHNCLSIRRRLVDIKKNINRLKNIDSVFYIGNDFSKLSYAKYQKPLYQLLPIINNKYLLTEEEIKNKKKTNVVYVGGTGLICKGLDIVIDAFLELPDFRLDIFGPSDENDFWNIYRNKIKGKNIFFHGFVSPNSSLFTNIVKKATYHVNCPAAEGMATSILLTNSYGVLPVVSYSSGINIQNFGYEIDNEKKSIIKKFNDLRDVSTDKTLIKINSILEYSKLFNLNSFKEKLKSNILDILHQK
jgi:hypothetical protein